MCFLSKRCDRMGPWNLHLPKSTFLDLFTCQSISRLLKTVKNGAFCSHLDGHWKSARPLLWRFPKFMAFKSLLIQLKLSSSHPYQPLVLISTAQCITGLRSKTPFADSQIYGYLYRYIRLHKCDYSWNGHHWIEIYECINISNSRRKSHSVKLWVSVRSCFPYDVVQA